MVQEIRPSGDYKETVLLKMGEGQQTLCCCHFHFEGCLGGTEAPLRVVDEGSRV